MAAVASRDNAQTFSDYLLFSIDILRLLVDSLVFALLNTILALEGSLYCIGALLGFGQFNWFLSSWISWLHEVLG